jgi:CDP-paratose 2-epimerase
VNETWSGSKAATATAFFDSSMLTCDTVRRAAANAEAIYHVAGQVGVTTSVGNPREDFEINALGSLNVLEAARLSGRNPAVVYTSTNKVYGALTGSRVEETATRTSCPTCPGACPSSILWTSIRLFQGRDGSIRPRLRPYLRPANGLCSA